jgi:dTDP-4-dehydrorhamnose reductase
MGQQPDADRCCDIGSPGEVAAIIAQERPDVVVHLAVALTDAAAEDVVAAK